MSFAMLMCLSCVLLLAYLISSRASTPQPTGGQQTIGRTVTESHDYAEGFNICFPGYFNSIMAPPKYAHSWISFGIRVNSMLAPLNDSFLSYSYCIPDSQSNPLLSLLHQYCHHLLKTSLSTTTLSSNPSSPSSPPQSHLWLNWDVIICRPLSSADGSGWIYVFREGRFIYKVGRTNNVARRAREWKYTCRAYPQIWLAAFRTPYAHRTERLVHVALEAICDSRPRIRCACQKTHIEKFVFKGQRDVVEQIIMSTIVFVIATVHQQYSNNRSSILYDERNKKEASVSNQNGSNS
ncbi:hypothetical protein C8R41DRAFT_919730 [Lentinula lateritia]|uniref:Bacteriophage T5 Orf172 DNA-binding domain-containing protein n=1 Tax=Lentinula lateritia TaxID=40482 RepID=A0ABQ8VGA8_9AGAR|nr:hypothetical protein C8R41DRAFT_919730 [Lentinula lateritia]